MNSKFLTYFKRKRAFIAVTLVGAIAVSGVAMKNASTQNASLAVLGEGVQTCFLRVSQSNTAKLLGQTNLEYLGSSFFTTSEECFAEALGTVQNKFQTEGKGILRNLNLLSSEVHNFHQKLRLPDEKGESLSALFSKVESLKEETLEEIETARLAQESLFDQARQIFFVLCGLFPFLFAWEMIERRRQESRVQALEEEALKQIQDGHPRLDGQMEVVIKRALELGEFMNCARLFENWSEGRIVTTQKVYHELSVPKKAETNVVEELNFEEKEAQIIEEEILKPVAGLKEISVEPLLAKVIDHLSSKIFTSGIMLDLDVSDDLHIMGREETLEQLFFHSILRSVNALSERSGVRRLHISVKRVGQNATLELTDNGESFSSDVLDAQVGLAFSAQEDLELTLCRELTKELGGQLIIENVLKGHKESGSKVKIRLSAAGLESKRLVSLKKGKKKDLMRELAN